MINHYIYADDLVVFSPCSSGLARLLEECEQYGAENDILYNPVKSALMVVRAPSDRQLILIGSLGFRSSD